MSTAAPSRRATTRSKAPKETEGSGKPGASRRPQGQANVSPAADPPVMSEHRLKRYVVRKEALRLHEQDRGEKIRSAEAQSNILGYAVPPLPPRSITRCTQDVILAQARASRENFPPDILSRQALRFIGRKLKKQQINAARRESQKSAAKMRIVERSVRRQRDADKMSTYSAEVA